MIKTIALSKTITSIAVALCISTAAHAIPFNYIYTDTISTAIGGLSAGQTAKITVSLDNLGSTHLSQTWTASDLQFVTFDFNNGGLVTTFFSPFGGTLSTGAGDFVTDSLGVLTSVLTDWADGSVAPDFTTTGATPLFWELGAGTFFGTYSVDQINQIHLTNSASMIFTSSWSLAAGTQVGEPTTLALMGLALAGLGFQRRKAA